MSNTEPVPTIEDMLIARNDMGRSVEVFERKARIDELRYMIGAYRMALANIRANGPQGVFMAEVVEAVIRDLNRRAATLQTQLEGETYER